MEDNVTDEEPSPIPNAEIALPHSVRFWLLLGSEIPSLTCSLFILYHFITDPTLRRSLHHHTTIAMNITALVFKCIDVPLYLNYIIVGEVWPQTQAHCLIWWLVDLGLYCTCCLLAAWASIERHIFIFHDQWLYTRKGRFFVHYLPLVSIIVYLTSYYTWVIFFPPCEITYDYTLPVCGATPCYLLHPILGVWESAVHGCLITMIIIVFSISLLIRFLLWKRRRHQIMQWRKHRKLTIQLLSISSIFIIFNFPSSVVAFIQLCGLPFGIGAILMPYFFFNSYWLIFLIPFVCLNSLPNLKQRVKRAFCISHRQQATVDVALVAVNANINRRS